MSSSTAGSTSGPPIVSFPAFTFGDDLAEWLVLGAGDEQGGPENGEAPSAPLALAMIAMTLTRAPMSTTTHMSGTRRQWASAA
jgi:hypothetical protein